MVISWLSERVKILHWIIFLCCREQFDGGYMINVDGYILFIDVTSRDDYHIIVYIEVSYSIVYLFNVLTFCRLLKFSLLGIRNAPFQYKIL